MPVLGEQRRFFVGLACQRDNMFTAGHRSEKGFTAEHTEALHKPLQIDIGQILVGKCQHMVLQPGLAHRANRRRIQRAGQIHPGDSCTASLA